jgi:GDP-L-fucose synthase
MDYYKDKNVLVTGGAGMIGRQIVSMLVDSGARVRVADLCESSRVHPGAEYMQLDLRDYGNCLRACDGVDYVFSLIGLKCSPKTVQERPATIMTNFLRFNTNMVDAAHKQKVERYLYTSTVGVYPPAEVFREDDVWSGMPSKNDWYGGWAKRIGELHLETLAIEHGWDKTTIVRPANVYGPFDNFDPASSMVVPSLIRKVIEGQNPLEIWGDGSPIRDFVHARDVARGMMMAVENCQGPFKPMNLGSGSGYSIKELVETIVDNVDKKPEVKWLTDKPSGDNRRVFDISRAKELLGWNPQISLKEGIRETMEWYKSNRDIIKRYDVFKE